MRLISFRGAAVGFDPIQLPDSSQRLVQLVEIGISEVVADVDLGWRDGPKWRREHDRGEGISRNSRRSRSRAFLSAARRSNSALSMVN